MLEGAKQLSAQIGVDMDILITSDASVGYQREWRYIAYGARNGPRWEFRQLMTEHFLSTSSKNVG